MAAFLLALIPDGMMIFYNGSQAPEGWEVVEDFAGRFPRACEPPGDTGGSEYHTHEVPDSVLVEMGGPCGGAYGPGGYSNTKCVDFPAVITRFDSASHVPPFRYFLAIRKVGKGHLLPKGAVLFFEDSVPEGWEIILPDSFPRAGKPKQVGRTGGSYYHTHVYKIEGYPPSADYTHGGTPDETFPIASIGVSDIFSCDSVSNLPPYTTLYVAELQEDNVPLPVGAIAMFDEEPSVPLWVIPRYYLGGRFIMGTSAYPGIKGGQAYHDHTCEGYVINYGGYGDIYGCRDPYACNGQYMNTFTLDYSAISWSFTTERLEALPPYRCVLFRKYLGTPSFSTPSLRGVFYAPGKLMVRGYQGSTLKLYSADGKLRLSVRITEEKEEVSVKGLPPGVYFAKIGLELYKFPLP